MKLGGDMLGAGKSCRRDNGVDIVKIHCLHCEIKTIRKIKELGKRGWIVGSSCFRASIMRTERAG